MVFFLPQLLVLHLTYTKIPDDTIYSTLTYCETAAALTEETIMESIVISQNHSYITRQVLTKLLQHVPSTVRHHISHDAIIKTTAGCVVHRRALITYPQSNYVYIFSFTFEEEE